MANEPQPGDERRGGTSEAGFHLRLEKPRQLLHIHLWGYWSVPTARAYAQGMREMFERLTGSPWYVIGDIRDSPIQSTDVGEIRRQLLEQATAMGMVRVAYVVSQSLPKMQLRRLSASAHTESGFFTSPPEAMTWLFRDAPAGNG